MAAKGARVVNREGPESKASMKRRAFAGCRTKEYREMVIPPVSEIDCSVKVNQGETEFMLKVLDENQYRRGD